VIEGLALAGALEADGGTRLPECLEVDGGDKDEGRRRRAVGLEFAETVETETVDWVLVIVLVVGLLGCLAFWGLVVIGLIAVF
jgi:hypothetical protein